MNVTAGMPQSPLAGEDAPTCGQLAPEPLRFRILDLFLILLGLPLLLVVGCGLAIAIVADSPGPVFYRCRRIGRDGEPFAMLKFRKMRADASGPSLTTLDDDRFTPIGKFLTVTRLDELPQVWNVVKGDMRLVGPRPEVEEFVALHPVEYAEILGVRPGLTGLAQLEFFMESRIFGDAHQSVGYYTQGILPYKVRLDLEYIRSRSLLGDILLVAKTPLLPARAATRRLALLLRQTGIVQAGIALALVGAIIALLATYAQQA